MVRQPLFFPSHDGHNGNGHDYGHRQRNAAEIAIFAVVAVVAATGALLDYLLGQPITFLMLTWTMLLWAVGGLLAGGLRIMLSGIVALCAALVVSEGNYAGAFLLTVASFILLHAQISWRR